MDDYYALLGVEPDAQTDEIRAAFRDKKDSVTAVDNDQAKGDAARLNKAWNVLSDPYQRGRYDEQRSQAEADGDLAEPEPLVVAGKAGARGGSRAAASKSTGKQTARERRQARQIPPEPTIVLPSGYVWPENRRRLLAMGIDLTVLLALFVIASFIVAPALARTYDRAQWDKSSELRDKFDAAHDNTTALDKKADAAEKKAKESKDSDDQAAAKAARQKADDAKDAEKKAQDAATKAQSKLFKYSVIALGGAFLLGFAYLVIPSGFTGATVGKRFQRLVVLRADGSRATWGDMIRRYGLIILVTFAFTLIPLIGVVGAVLVLVGVTTWMRNPNKQGLHDRFAKTIVVAPAP